MEIPDKGRSIPSPQVATTFTKFQSNGKEYPMRNTAFSGVAPFSRRGAYWSLVNLLLAFSALAVIFTGPISVAGDSKERAVLPAPSAGESSGRIYRLVRRMPGRA